MPCKATGAAALAVPVLVVLAVAAGAGLPLWLLLRQHRTSSVLGRARHRSLSALRSCAAHVVRLDLIAKLKLVLAYYQVVLVMPEAFQEPLRPEYDASMASSMASSVTGGWV